MVRQAFEPGVGWKREIPEAARGLVACAMAFDAGDDAARRKVAEDALRDVFGSTQPGLLATQMPWVVWAEQRLGSGRDRLPAAAALGEFREQIFASVVTAEAAGVDGADLVGGVVFTKGGPALPTWQTLRAAAAMASMLGDSRLTPRDTFMRELSRALTLTRFARQLTADEFNGFAYAEPERAIFGVRLAVFDSRMPPQATALTLVMLADLADALQRGK
jgi:hypothetical protein